MFVDHLLPGIRVQKDHKRVKTGDGAVQLIAVDQKDGHGRAVFADGVEIQILAVFVGRHK